MIFGIDLGSFKTTVSYYNGKQYDILLNEIGQRDSQNLVAFRNNQRLFAESAFLQQKSNLQNTFQFFTRFIGNLTQQDLEFEKQFIYNNVNQKISDDNNFIENFYIVQDYFKNNLQINCIQILSCFLKNILNKQDIKQGFISVPDYFNHIQRVSVYQALDIAKLSQIKVVNQSDSIALAYQYQKQPLNQKVLFIDFGHSKLSLSAYNFKDDKIYQIKNRAIKNFGVRLFDICLYKFYINKFKMDLSKSNKARMRLMDAIQKQRKELSANQDSSIYIESFIDGEDFNYLLKRSEYYQIIDQQLFDFRQYVTEFQNLNVDSVEVIGGGIRIPIIQEIINKHFDNKLKQSLNSTEAISYGSLNHIQSDNLVHFNDSNFSYQLIQNNQISDKGVIFKGDSQEKYKNTIEFQAQTNIFQLMIFENQVLVDIYQFQLYNNSNMKMQVTFEVLQNKILLMKQCNQYQTLLLQDKNILIQNPDLLVICKSSYKYSFKTLQSYIEVENQMSKNDLSIVEQQENKNKCESVLYSIQGQINDFITKIDKNQSSQLLEKITKYLNLIEDEVLPSKKYMSIIYEINHNFEPLKAQIKQQSEILEKFKILQTQLDRFYQEKNNIKNGKTQIAQNKIQNLQYYLDNIKNQINNNQIDHQKLVKDLDEKIKIYSQQRK